MRRKYNFFAVSNSVHSSQKRPLHSVLQESSSKRPRIDSILSGNTSDVEVDLPQGIVGIRSSSYKFFLR